VADAEIRRAREEDLPVILALLEELNEVQREWRVFPPREDYREQLLGRYRTALDRTDSLVLVAVDGDRVVGTAYGHVHVPSTFSDEPALELAGVFVAPSHRRRGIGMALSREVARFAKDLGVRRLTLKTFAQNDLALRFWETLGFTPRMVQFTGDPDAILGDRDPA
jgi:GNAT superfamily N-acetyltransferase